MPRWVALLRGVSPMNAKMPQVRAAYEAAGFTDVVTVLASGNVVFDSRSASESAVHKKAAAAMEEHLPQTLPLEQDGARILALEGRELYSAYVVGDKGPVFMNLIEKTFGKDVTTRTWDTVRKCAAA